MIRAYRYALDPSPAQERLLRSHCGAARYAYNQMLDAIKADLAHREAERSRGVAEADLTPGLGWSAWALRREWNARKEELAPWWREVSKEAFATGCANLAAALKNWSDSRKGLRRGKPVGFPRYKSRRTTMSCTFTIKPMRVEPSRHHVTLPRLGRIHTHESTRSLARRIENGTARITKATVAYRRGRWQVSLLAHVEQSEPRHARLGSVVGVDVGVKDLLVAATPAGEEVLRVPVPAVLRELEVKRRTLQRRNRHRHAPRRVVRPSNRWRRAQRRIDRLDWRMANIREDTLHKATTELCSKYETVVVEDLNVAGMLTRGGAYKRGLNRAISRAAMSNTRRLLGYKAEREGGALVAVDRFYPSSKTCSGCGSVRTKLTLRERTYECDDCGMSIDRDLNAATNLARLAYMAGSAPVTGRGAKRKTTHPSGGGAAGNEASTSRRVSA